MSMRFWQFFILYINILLLFLNLFVEKLSNVFVKFQFVYYGSF